VRCRPFAQVRREADADEQTIFGEQPRDSGPSRPTATRPNWPAGPFHAPAFGLEVLGPPLDALAA
jgi:hypothetical protein